MKIILLTGTLLALSIALFAQPGDGERQEKLKALKIAFITNKLDLTSEEAKLFWPVHNGYEDGMESIRKEMRLNAIETRLTFEDMDDKQVNDAIDKMINLRQKEVDHLRKFKGEFMQVLPARKVAMLFKAEHDFKKKLLDLLNERTGPGGPGFQR